MNQVSGHHISSFNSTQNGPPLSKLPAIQIDIWFLLLLLLPDDQIFALRTGFERRISSVGNGRFTNCAAAAENDVVCAASWEKI